MDRKPQSGVSAKVVIAHFAQRFIGHACNGTIFPVTPAVYLLILCLDLWKAVDDDLTENLDEMDKFHYIRILGFLTMFHANVYIEKQALWDKQHEAGMLKCGLSCFQR